MLPTRSSPVSARIHPLLASIPSSCTITPFSPRPESSPSSTSSFPTSPSLHFHILSYRIATHFRITTSHILPTPSISTYTSALTRHPQHQRNFKNNRIFFSTHHAPSMLGRDRKWRFSAILSLRDAGTAFPENTTVPEPPSRLSRTPISAFNPAETEPIPATAITALRDGITRRFKLTPIISGCIPRSIPPDRLRNRKHARVGCIIKQMTPTHGSWNHVHLHAIERR